jgi:GNAT superfamily N-acetyltransferase
MLVRNALEGDFLEIVEKSKEWADIVVEREGVYHVMTAHFRGTCFVAEDMGKMIGYLLGFRSQTHPDQAYLHLVQVDPRMRGHGIGRKLYRRFEEAVKAMGCKKVVASSRPQNRLASRFFEFMGFKHVESKDVVEVDGVMAVRDYNGPGKHVVLWSKDI